MLSIMEKDQVDLRRMMNKHKYVFILYRTREDDGTALRINHAN